MTLNKIVNAIVRNDGKTIGAQWQLAQYVFVSLSQTGEAKVSQQQVADSVNSALATAYGVTAYRPFLQGTVSRYNKAWHLFGQYIDRMEGVYAPEVAAKMVGKVAKDFDTTDFNAVAELWNTIPVALAKMHQKRSAPRNGTVTDPADKADTGTEESGGAVDVESTEAGDMVADLLTKAEAVAKALGMSVKELLSIMQDMA